MTKLKSKTDFREMTNLYTKWVARPNRLSNSTKSYNSTSSQQML